jgi:hypothetical protein
MGGQAREALLPNVSETTGTRLLRPNEREESVMIVFLKAHAKSILAAIAAGGVAIQAAISDDVITSAEKVAIVLAVLTALGVYAVPNDPPKSPPLS